MPNPIKYVYIVNMKENERKHSFYPDKYYFITINLSRWSYLHIIWLEYRYEHELFNNL